MLVLASTVLGVLTRCSTSSIGKCTRRKMHVHLVSQSITWARRSTVYYLTKSKSVSYGESRGPRCAKSVARAPTSCLSYVKTKMRLTDATRPARFHQSSSSSDAFHTARVSRRTEYNPESHLKPRVVPNIGLMVVFARSLVGSLGCESLAGTEV